MQNKIKYIILAVIAVVVVFFCTNMFVNASNNEPLKEVPTDEIYVEGGSVSMMTPTKIKAGEAGQELQLCVENTGGFETTYILSVESEAIVGGKAEYEITLEGRSSKNKESKPHEDISIPLADNLVAGQSYEVTTILDSKTVKDNQIDVFQIVAY